MIVMMLFLILFAILFPKALKLLLALMFLGGIMVLGQAHARQILRKVDMPTQCSLTVNSKVYINKICNGEFDKDGSFTIGTDNTSTGAGKRNKYFVYMNHNSDGTMTGYWNGIEAETHASEPLGVLSKSGRCWSNSHAQVCAIAGE